MSSSRFQRSEPKLFPSVVVAMREFDVHISELHRSVSISATLEAEIATAEARRETLSPYLKVASNTALTNDLRSAMDDDLGKLCELGQSAIRLEDRIAATYQAASKVFGCVERYMEAEQRFDRWHAVPKSSADGRDRERDRSPPRCVPFERTIVEAGFHDCHRQKRLPWGLADSHKQRSRRVIEDEVDEVIVHYGAVWSAMGILLSSLDQFLSDDEPRPVDLIIQALADAACDRARSKSSENELSQLSDQLEFSKATLRHANDLLATATETFKCARHISAAADTLLLAQEYTKIRLAPHRL